MRAQGKPDLRVRDGRWGHRAIDLGDRCKDMPARRVAAGVVALAGEAGDLAAGADVRRAFAVGAAHLHTLRAFIDSAATGWFLCMRLWSAGVRS